MRNQTMHYLVHCQQNGMTAYEISFLMAFIHYKNNDFSKALSVIKTIPDVGSFIIHSFIQSFNHSEKSFNHSLIQSFNHSIIHSL